MTLSKCTVPNTPTTPQWKRKRVTKSTTPVRKSRRLADRPSRQYLEELEVDLEELEVDFEFEDLPDVLPDVLPEELPEGLPEQGLPEQLPDPVAAVVSPTPTSTSVSPLPGQRQRRSTYIGDVNKTIEQLFHSAKVIPKAVTPAKPKKQLTIAAVGLTKTVGCGPALIDQSTLRLQLVPRPLTHAHGQRPYATVVQKPKPLKKGQTPIKCPKRTFKKA